MTFLGARIAQSAVHIGSGTARAISARFTFYSVQLVCLVCLVGLTALIARGAWG